MFFLIMLNCVAMAYEYPAMNQNDLDGQILFWRCAHHCCLPGRGGGHSKQPRLGQNCVNSQRPGRDAPIHGRYALHVRTHSPPRGSWHQRQAVNSWSSVWLNTPSMQTLMLLLHSVLACSDLVFTIAFTIEAVLKIVAFGFRPYMSYFQNIIDILIVVSSLVMLVLDTVADLSVVQVSNATGSRDVDKGRGRGGGPSTSWLWAAMMFALMFAGVHCGC